MTATPHVNKSTPCGHCDHRYGAHCESGRMHWDTEDYLFCCIFAHCQCGPCQCWAFVNPFTGKVTAWKRPVEEITPCASCGHPKKHHCRKGRISIEVDGVPYGCSHYMKSVESDFSIAPSCDSTACAEVLDVEQEKFCPCPRFVSPYARPRQKKRTTTKGSKSMNLFEPEELEHAHAHYLTQHAPETKTRAEILLEVIREFPDATVAELATAAKRSPSWVRKHLRAAGIVVKPTRQKKAEVRP